MDALSLLKIAEDAATSAGALLRERFGGPAQGVTTKSSPTDVVSDADRDAERLLLQVIGAARPADGVLSEEGGGGESRSGLRWIVDPLDGTVNFLFGIPVWSVSIAVEDGQGILAGVVHAPLDGETFSATRRGGTRLNGELVTVSDKEDLATALVGTGFSYDRRTRAQQAELLQRVLPRVRDIRRAGSAALDMTSVACGRFDAFYEADMHVWDRAAGELIVREAGGVVSPLRAPFGGTEGVIAAGPGLHGALRDLVLR